MVLDKIKTVVSRTVGAELRKGVSGGSQVACTSGSALTSTGPGGTGGRTLMSLMAEASKIANALFEEREWQCPCGHKFRASGEWIATVPTMCEVPTCPNPKFYLEGTGRQLLEANPQGVRLQEVDPSKTLPPQGNGGSGSSSCGMGGRFGPRK